MKMANPSYSWITLPSIFIHNIPLDIKKVYLKFYKVSDTPFHIQGVELCERR